MTVETTTRSVVYKGNGSTTIFPFNFVIPTGTLRVSLRDAVSAEILQILTPGSYSVMGLDDPEGGSVVYPLAGNPISSAVKIVIERLVEYKQELNIPAYGGFNPGVLMNQLDRIVMQVQQVAEGVERSLKLPLGSDGSSVDFPDIIEIRDELIEAVEDLVAVAATLSPIGTPLSFELSPGTSSVTIEGGYDVGKVKRVYLNGLLLSGWTADDGETITFSTITSDDIIAGESYATLTVEIGDETLGLAALDARYLRLTSDPRKDMIRLGCDNTGDPERAGTNTAILAAAFTDIEAKGQGEIYFGPGTFRLTDIPTLFNSSVMIAGCGAGVSQLAIVPGSSGHGFNIDLETQYRKVEVRDLTLLAANGQSGGAAIRVKYPPELSGILKGVVVDNLEIRGINDASAWAADVWLINSWLFRISNCTTKSRPFAYDGYGIRLDGPCTDGLIFNNRIFYRDKTFFLSDTIDVGYGTAEGVNLVANTAVACLDGVYANTGNNYPDLRVLNNHLNVKRYGVRAIQRPQIDISHNNIYRWFEDESEDFVGIQLELGSADGIIDSNKIYGYTNVGVRPSEGIVCGASNGGHITNNLLRGVDIGVNLVGTAKALVENNSFDHLVTTKITGVPAGALVRNNIAVASDGGMTSFNGEG